MKRWAFGYLLLGLLGTSIASAQAPPGVYEDPLGRYRFAFTGRWRVGADETDPNARDHFYCIKDGVVVAELIVRSSPLPRAMRLRDVVDAEIERIDADPGVHRASLDRTRRISGQSATCLIARVVGDNGRETLAVQYWFIKGSTLWSLLVLTTPAEEARSKRIRLIENSVIDSFEALEPDEVVRAVAESKKTARLGNGLAAITLPERWTLAKVEDDLLTTEFDMGCLYLFAVTNQPYGATLDAVVHGFLEHHDVLEGQTLQLEGDCDLHGTAGYYVILTGTRDDRAFTVQLIAVVRGADAFLLYGIAESAIWPQAQPWLTAVQSSITLFGSDEPADSSTDESAATE